MPAKTPIDNLGEFGQAVRLRRAELGISQDRLAEMVGCAQSHISAAERGARDLRMSFVRDIARVLELPLTGLLAKLAADAEDPDMVPTESYDDVPREAV